MDRSHPHRVHTLVLSPAAGGRRRDRRGPVTRGRAGPVVAGLAAACVTAAALGGELLGLLVLAAIVVTWVGLYETVGLGG